MNKLAKKMAKREGFTLVELIVVIAILGILAGIAIPVYSGYISKANEASDLQQLDAIKTAAIFAAIDNANEKTVDSIAVTMEDKVVKTVTVTYVKETGESTAATYVATDKVQEYLGGTMPTMKSTTFASSANWTKADEKWTA